ncbi:MAG: 8-amino-7-oxononanoate synthase, partial [Solirubrobacteraceae bacterium]
MIEIEARLDELRSLGLRRRTRLVSGPQGPHVLLDGKPVLLLCSNNYLGLADHPRVRQAAADAAMRWGVGAGASRLVSGTMTIHRRLEEALAAFKGRDSALLFGSGYLANAGTIAALARPGDIVFSDEFNHASIIDGCRLSRAEVFVYDHCDPEHLAWGIARAEGRGALIVTDSVFSMDGDVAPLAEIVELARRHGLRTVVDEAHGTGAVGPGGRGALAQAGLEGQVDVIVGTLGKALGAYGAFVACDAQMSRYLINCARTFIFSTALPPPAVAAALTGLDLLIERPQMVDRLAANAAALRRGLEREGFDVGGSRTQILPLIVGDAELSVRICEEALSRGVFAQAIRPPTVPPMTSRLRLAVMATHHEDELRRRRRRRARGDGAADGAPRPARRGVRLRGRPAGPPGRLSRGPQPAVASRPVRDRPRDPRALRGLFVTGTDTGVGKTVVAAAIVAALRERGVPVQARKPVVTGLDEPADAEWPPDHVLLAGAAGSDPGEVVAIGYGPPVSPHLAAELQGGDPPTVASLAAAVRAGAESGVTVVVEGVGGLLVPLGPDGDVRALAVELDLPLVIAARPWLGTINHTLLTLEAARRAGLRV